MRTLRLVVGAVAVVASSFFAGSEATALPSFPGAQGFGAVASGGRGGQVIKVTTLAASGPGSLQAALNASGPRIVVFEVSGVIDGDIVIPHGDLTIAGQTASGAGITIAGRLTADYDAEVSNVIIRHIRVRPIYDGSPGAQFDGAQFSTSSKIILDHVSISWGVDETLDMYSAQDITVQWSTIEESATSGHPEGQHNYGLINGPEGRRISVHHNLFVHHRNRNPAIANGPAEVYNNVAYNVRHGFVHHNPASGKFNIVGNTYMAGPDDDLFPFFFDDENGFEDPTLGYYLADNYVDDPGVFTGTVNNPWAEQSHPSFEYLEAPASFRSPTPFDFAGTAPGWVPVSVQSAQEASALVLESAGGFPRDVVTKRMLAELEARNGDWGVDAPGNLLEGLTPSAAPADDDNDGMPNSWEVQEGLNPQNPADNTTVRPSGYTAIEDYINGVADSLAGGSPGGGNGGGGDGGNGPGVGGGSGVGASGPNGSGGTGSASGGSGGGGSNATDGGGDGCDCSLNGDSANGNKLGSALLLGLGLFVGLRGRRPRHPRQP